MLMMNVKSLIADGQSLALRYNICDSLKISREMVLKLAATLSKIYLWNSLNVFSDKNWKFIAT